MFTRRLLPLILFTLLAAPHLCACLYAPEGKEIQWTQPDGTTIPLRVIGNKFYARTETLDGYTVVFDQPSQTYKYATTSPDGQDLIATTLTLGQGNPQTLGLAKNLDILPAAKKSKSAARFAQWDEETENSLRWSQLKAQRKAYAAAVEAAKTGDAPMPAPPTFSTLGEKQGLTILIDFSDAPGTIPQASVIDYCNSDNYTGYNNNGSVKKYFQDNSSGLLTYTNTVTAYIRMAQPKSYYNDTTKASVVQGQLLLNDALDILKALPNYATEILPTFDDLTVDASNQVIACNVFYAGADSGVWSYGLWPHASAINPTKELSIGGKKIRKYQITNLGNSLSLGTFCHENGHMLCGYPDIYDYDGDSKGGAGRFCLMNSGNHPTNPTLICAYLRRASGWTTTTELTNTSSLTATLTSTVGHADFNKIYRYSSPAALSTEYYLLENRQKTGRDAQILGSGIAIWHVDELGDRDNQNLASNSAHLNYEVSLIQADNLWQFQNNSSSGDTKDLYYLGNPASGYANTFNDNSAPDSKWWSGANSGFYIYDFSASGPTMTMQIGLPANLLTLTSPNGGDQYYYGSSQNIRWVSSTPGNVKIELFKAGILHTVLAPNDTNDGNYTWLIPTSLPAASDYTIQVTSVTTPSISDASDSTFSILTQPAIAEALDTTNLVWFTPGLKKWFAQSTTTHDGVDAAESGNLNHGEFINLETSITGPGTLTFWWKVSSEFNRDFLNFYLDGTLQTGSLGRISGLVDWTQKTVIIPAGNHALKWSYTKSGSGDGNLDTAWLDQVSYLPVSTSEIVVQHPLDTDLTDGASTIDCGISGLTNSAPPVTFTVKNTGGDDLTGLTLTKSGSHAADFTLSSIGATTLPAGESTTFTVTFAGTAGGPRTANIHLASSDIDESPFDITVTGTAVTVGTLVVSSSGNAISEGSFGGPFSPASHPYTLTNPGPAAIDWAVGKTAPWLDLSATTGTLAPGASTIVTATINTTADGLAIAYYSDTLTFTNTSNNNGDTTRNLALNVLPIPATITLTDLIQPYDRNAKSVTVTTQPPGLAYLITYEGFTFLPTNSGTYNVVATIIAPNYSGTTTADFQITPAAQTINFAALNPVPGQQGTLALTASATSDLTVSYSSSNSSVATISGSTVNIIAPGTTTITATQSGNQNYAAATPVQQTLTVLDLTPPAIASLSPADNATNAPNNANLIVTFSEAVARGTGDITLKNLTDATQSTIPITDVSQVSLNGAVLTINPAADLLIGKNYAIQIATAAIIDSATNPFPGITDDTTWNFTTISPPNTAFWAGISGNWSAPATWLNGTIATGIDFTANFTGIDIAADQTITLDSARTIGNITFTDLTPTNDATISGGNILTLDRTSSVPTIDVTQAGRTLTISSVIAGSDGLQKNGLGTLNLTGLNTYTANTTVSAGTLRLEGNSANAASGGFFSSVSATRNYAISSGATLNLHNASVPVGTANFTGAGTLLISGGGISAGNSGRAVNVNLSAGAVIDIASGTGWYNGGWQAFTWTNNKATLSVNGGLDIADGKEIIADALTGSGSFSGSQASGGDVNFTLGTNNGSGTFTGMISNTGTRVVSLVKNGSGTQTLTNTATVRGSTTINAGTLAISGSLSTTSVTVNNTATLGGNGNIAGNVSIANGARHALAVAATPAAQVTRAITGTLTLTSGNILDLTAAAPPAAGVYVLATATTAITGTPTTINSNVVNGVISVDTASTPKRLLLTITGNTYATWINTFPAAASMPGFTQDADNDGIKNGIENFFGTNPTTASTGLLPGTKTANTFTFTHPQNASPASNITATYRWSKNLATFQDNGANDGNGTTVSFTTVTNAGITTVTATITGTATEKLFVDVKVLQN